MKLFILFDRPISSSGIVAKTPQISQKQVNRKLNFRF